MAWRRRSAKINARRAKKEGSIDHPRRASNSCSCRDSADQIAPFEEEHDGFVWVRSHTLA
eukprot:6001-Pleurochrysis_carterae.AAC.1